MYESILNPFECIQAFPSASLLSFLCFDFYNAYTDPVDFERVRITVLLHCSLNLFHRHQSIGAVTENDVVKSGICD